MPNLALLNMVLDVHTDVLNGISNDNVQCNESNDKGCGISDQGKETSNYRLLDQNQLDILICINFRQTVFFIYH